MANRQPETPIRLALMGINGPERDLFFDALTDKPSQIRRGEQSSPAAYIAKGSVNGDAVWLINTPSSALSDSQLLHAVKKALDAEQGEGNTIHGLIYLHDIRERITRETAERNVERFNMLLGPVARANVVIVTTLWDMLPLTTQGHRTERELSLAYSALLPSVTVRRIEDTRHDGTNTIYSSIIGGIVGRVKDQLQRENRIADAPSDKSSAEQLKALLAARDKEISGLMRQFQTLKKVLDEQAMELKKKDNLQSMLVERDEEIVSFKVEFRNLKGRLDQQASELKKNAQLKELLDEKNEDIAHIKQAVQGLREELHEHALETKKSAGIWDILAKNNDEISGLKTAHRALRDNFDEHAAVSKKHAKIGEQLVSTNEEVANIKIRFRGLEDSLDRHASDMKNMIQQQKRLVGSGEEETANLRSQLRNLEGNLEEHESELKKILQLQDHISGIDGEVSGIKDGLETLRESLGNHSSELKKIVRLQGHVVGVDKETASLKLQFQYLKETVDKQDSELKKSAAEVQALRSKLDASQKAAQQSKAEMERQKTTFIAETTDMKANFNADKSELEARVTKLETEYTDMIERILADIRAPLAVSPPPPSPPSSPGRQKPPLQPRPPLNPKLNILDANGEFPLYQAAATGDYEQARMLLDQGADPSMKTRFSWTALHWAAGNDHANIVQLLLSYGAEVNATSDTRRTPLMMAKRDDIRRILIEGGAKR